MGGRLGRLRGPEPRRGASAEQEQVPDPRLPTVLPDGAFGQVSSPFGSFQPIEGSETLDPHKRKKKPPTNQTKTGELSEGQTLMNRVPRFRVRAGTLYDAFPRR